MSTILPTSGAESAQPGSWHVEEKQVTRGPGGRILTNTGVWSPDGKWIVYDTRPDAAGDVFEGLRIEMVNVETGEVRRLYEARNEARCGVATFDPVAERVAFILGPENPTPDWEYGVSHRQGVIVEVSKPGLATNLDARDLTPPFTAGALRGGTHVHVWDSQGNWVSFTYNDALVESDIRDVGVSVPVSRVQVDRRHRRSHDGNYFSAIVSKTTANPKPGSDEIKRACEEGWVGANGYVRTNGTLQRRALAFQGQVVTTKGATISEVFIADLPDDLTRPGGGPLGGKENHRPFPPRGVSQRRLTFTAERKYPGLQGPRHWLRSSPDGSSIAFLMKDDAGIAQIWIVSPNGGLASQLTRNSSPIASAFTWSRDGRYIAHAMDNSVAITDAKTGATTPLTPRTTDALAPRPESCVFSPDGGRIAYVRRVPINGVDCNQIFVLTLKP